ncbi:hypothetical protein ASPBRDRAFT_104567, partial [Aspergillus brasiliensis CBS 101740]
TKPDEGIVAAAWRAGNWQDETICPFGFFRELTWFFSPRVMAHGKKIDSGQRHW